MRVAYECTTVVPRRSGIGRVAEQLAYALERTAPEGDELRLLTNRGPLDGLKMAPHFGPLRPTPLWMQLAVPRIARHGQFDLFHFTNSTAPVRFRAPYVTTIHDLSLIRMPGMHPVRRRAYQRTLLGVSAARARLVITISQSSARDLTELLGVPEDRIVVTPMAVDARFKRPIEPAEIASAMQRYGLARPYLLYVGNIEPRKNLVRLIDAFEAVGADGVTLALAGGGGWMSGPVARRVADYSGRGSVRLSGYVDDADLPPLYAGAEAVVYPSLWEGFGLPVLEALTVGAPVIASHIPAIVEVAEDAAVLVDPNSVEELRDAIARILSDSALRTTLRERGLARSQKYDWDTTARQTWVAYHRALEL